MKKSILILTTVSLLSVFSSCNDNKNEILKTKGDKGNILIATSLPNPDGMSGAVYMQLISEFTTKSIDNKAAIPIPYGSAYPLIIGNDIFIFPSYIGDTKNELLKYTRKNNRLQKTGTLKLPPNSSANNIVKASSTKAYLSLAKLGKIWIFNPSTMKKTGEIDLASLGYKDKNPDSGIMILRDGILFVGLNQMVGGWFPSKEYNYSDIAVIDTEKDEIVKMISEKTSGFSMATRPIDHNSIFMDEKKDIYISCIGGFGMVPGHKAGILRIKAGETDFDTTYQFPITGASIEGESKTPSFISSIHYTKNGKAYGYLNIPGYYKKGENGHTAIADRAVEINIYNKTLKKINGLELSNGYGIMVAKTKNGLAICNSSKTEKGIYSLDINTGKVSEKPIIKTVGNPMSFYYFDN